MRKPLRRRHLAVAVSAALCALAGHASAQPVPNVVPSLRTGGTAGSFQVPTQGMVGGTLVNGGFVADPRAYGNGGQRLDIVQSQSRFTLDWNSFDIGASSLVQFHQPNAAAAALNLIHQGNPSQIFGQLLANGQVYLLNQNGFLFGRDSTVNVHTLVVSSLLLRNNGTQNFFANGPEGMRSGPTTILPAFDGYVISGGQAPDIRLQGTIQTHQGGAVMVFGPRVLNEGRISAPDGQVILAAGEKVWLASSTDPRLRGYLVEFQAKGPATNLAESLVQNSGEISAARGSATLAGLAVNTTGSVSATTSALLNGSVWLIAKEGRNALTETAATLSNLNAASVRTGSVTLGAGSRTLATIDEQDTGTVAQSQAMVVPRVTVEGKEILVQGTVAATGGDIRILASEPRSGGTPSWIYIEDGAVVSAAGAWVDLPAERRIAEIQITSNELKDSPALKGGPLQGAKLLVDLTRYVGTDIDGSPMFGTPLFQTQPFIDNVQRSAAEKAAAGGSILLSSMQGDVVVREGSVLDVSGGGLRYAPGMLSTSYLVSGGRLYNVAEAPRDRPYQQVISDFQKHHARWGVTERYSIGQFGSGAQYPSELLGAAGGSLQVVASGGSVLQGDLRASVVAGPSQMASGRLPAYSKLVLGTNSALGVPNYIQQQVVLNAAAAALAPSFGPGGALPADLQNRLTLPGGFLQSRLSVASGQLRQDAFGHIEIYANQSIEILPGQAIELPAGGSLLLAAQDVSIGSSIRAPAGAVTVKGIDTAAPGTTGAVTLAGGAAIDVRGTWINETPAGRALAAQQGGSAFLPRHVPALPGQVASYTPGASSKGGSVVIDSKDITLQAGSLIDVSAGGRLSASGSFAGGSAGSITLRTGFGTESLSGLGALALGGELAGYGYSGGGSLTLVADRVRIGGSAPAVANELVLAPERFTQGGFSSYSLTGLGGATIAAGTQVQVSADSLVALGGAAQVPTGGDLRAASLVTTLAPNLRKPTSFSLATSRSGAELRIEAGASVTTEAKGEITIDARDHLLVDGALTAPGGRITLRLRSPGSPQDNSLAVALHVGANARLSAAGTFIPAASAAGVIAGEVLRGGDILVEGAGSGLLIDSGALIDVSGAASPLDLPVFANGQSSLVRSEVTSDAGTITLRSSGAARIEGTLRGRAQGRSVGGTVVFDMYKPNPLDRGDGNPDGVDRRVVLAQSAAQFGAAGAPVVGSLGAPAIDGFLAVGGLAAEGIDKLRVRAEDAIVFRGDLDLSLGRAIRLDAPVYHADAAATVALSAPQVALGATPRLLPSGFVPPAAAPNPGAAPASLVVAAHGGASSAIDLYGSSTLHGFSSATFDTSGDLRLSSEVPVDTSATPDGVFDRLAGALRTSGELTLRAAQVYPATMTDFTLAATGPDSSIVVRSSGMAPGAALSAAGSVTLEADTISQGGVLRAPMGRINLNGASQVTLEDGSVTSVSGKDLTVPLGGIAIGGETWKYSTVAGELTVDGLGAKRVAVTAPDIDQKAGALVDLSGGGEVYGLQFLSGSGGTRDVLGNGASDFWVIVPDLALGAAPIDARIGLVEQAAGKPPVYGASLAFGADASAYDSIQLAGGNGLPAGTYRLLPGYYAFLPGAYLVQKQGGTKFADLAPGRVSGLADGTPVLAGRLTSAASGAAESRWSGFSVVRPHLLKPGQLTQAEYLYNTSQYLADRAFVNDLPMPALPRDAGTLRLAQAQTVRLDGELRAAAAPGGTSGSLEIAAGEIAIVASRSGAPGALELEAGRLSELGVRLLIGGTRSDAGDGIDVAATRVHVENAGADLVAPEIILAATQEITVGAGSVIRGEGSYGGAASEVAITGPGALLRASGDAELKLARDGSFTPGATTGTVTLAAGSSVSAARSLLLDATQAFDLQGSIVVDAGGALDITAPRILLGDTAGVTQAGLKLDNTQIAAFGSLGSLTLGSYSTIDFHGAVTGDAALGSAALGRLTLRGAGLAGYQAGGASGAQIVADTVVLENSGGRSFTGTPDGTGELSIKARRILVGSGDQDIRGFGSATLEAAADLVATGAGSLELAGSGLLTLNASRISAATGANFAIGAADVAIGLPGSPAAPAEALQPGGILSITAANTLTQGGRIELPAGTVKLKAGGNLVLAEGSYTGAAAYAKPFFDVTAYASGGRVELVSAAGNVELANGAVLDVSAPAGGNAGEVAVDARAGAFVLSGGELRGAAAEGRRSGSFALDAGSVGELGALADKLAAGGFGERIDVRARTGDLSLAAGGTLRAREVALSTDAGSITLSGLVDASTPAGEGRVEVVAARDLLLEGQILAKGLLDATDMTAAELAAAPDSHGGLVRLESRNDASSKLTFASGALIDVSAGAKGDGGRIELITSRASLAANGATDNQVVLKGTVAGGGGAHGGRAGEAILYARETVSTGGTLDNAAIAALAPAYASADAAALDAATRSDDAINQLVQGGASSLALSGRVALEVQNQAGSITVGNASGGIIWDLTNADWLLDKQRPGLLTLRARDTVDIRGSVGLPNDDLIIPGPNFAEDPTDFVTDFKSWSIRLVGGADFAAASATATKLDAGDVKLTVRAASTSGTPTSGSGQMTRVRTGTGDIEVYAGRDFAIERGTVALGAEVPRAGLYTSGRPAIADDVDGFDNRYLTDGGDIRIVVQGSARGLNLDSLDPATGTNNVNYPAINDWLRRDSAGTSVFPASGWWVDRRFFAHSVGSFGGGDISISAGGDVDRLSAAVASSGCARAPSCTDGVLQQFGGGDLSVSARGSIIGGEYLVANGAASIRAGGTVGEVRRTALFMMGESEDPARAAVSASVEALRDVRLQAIANPTALASTDPARPGSQFTTNQPGYDVRRAFFFSYGERSSAELISVAGNVDLENTPRPLRSNSGGAGATLWDVVPSQLRISALSGSVLGGKQQFGQLVIPIDQDWRLFPSRFQSLEILAGTDIGNIRFEAGDVLPSSLMAWNHTAFRQTGTQASLGDLSLAAGAGRLVQYEDMASYRYRVYAGNDLYDTALYVPGKSQVRAARDLDTVHLDLQNLQAGEESRVIAGRDIRQSDLLRSGQTSSGINVAGISIAGPGRLLVQAGREIDLGSSGGISASGASGNSSLTSRESARLSVVAGYKGDLTLASLDLLMAELLAGGETKDLARGDRAIAATFDPALTSATGNLVMYSSSIITDSGSGIDLFVPSGAAGSALGGNINAGLPGAAAGASNGVITRFGGSIRTFTKNDFQVNASKVLTQLGGDIVAYSSHGSIDAGRGARTSVASSAASFQSFDLNADGFVDPLAERFLRPPLSSVGSGIRTNSFDPDGGGPLAAPSPGSIYLFAPRGTIDAGEAGIVSAGNIVVLALQVLNAQNITAQGSSTGIPVVSSGISGAMAAAAGSAASATQSVADAARSVAPSGPRPSFITVRVLGFGE